MQKCQAWFWTDGGVGDRPVSAGARRSALMTGSSDAARLKRRMKLYKARHKNDTPCKRDTR
jgi:hypothetical protein